MMIPLLQARKNYPLIHTNYDTNEHKLIIEYEVEVQCSPIS